MKLNSLMKPLILGVALALTTAGCISKTPKVTHLPKSANTSGTNGETTPGNALAGSSNSVPSAEEIKGGLAQNSDHHIGWAKDPEALKAQTVHFDYDSSVVKASEKSKVSAVADFLKGNPAKALEVDGHCDERGTEEYNRSLGERRALALREELAKEGISPERVDTFTFGRDRPVDTGRSEESHAKNRRGEFIVLSPPTQ